MKFFFDRNMSPLLARMVDIFERDHTVRHHDDDSRFVNTTPDVEWIKALSEDDEPWIVVSGDGRILKNKSERQVLDETGLVFFALSKQWMHMNFQTDFAWKFIRVWPDVVSTTQTSNRRLFRIAGGKSIKIEAIS